MFLLIVQWIVFVPEGTFPSNEIPICKQTTFRCNDKFSLMVSRCNVKFNLEQSYGFHK